MHNYSGMKEMIVAGAGVHVQANVALSAHQGTILGAPILFQADCVLLVTSS